MIDTSEKITGLFSDPVRRRELIEVYLKPMIGMDTRPLYKRKGKAYYKVYKNSYIGQRRILDDAVRCGIVVQPKRGYYVMTQFGMEWMGRELGVRITKGNK